MLRRIFVLDKKENRVKLYGVIAGIVTLILQHAIYLAAYGIAQKVGIEPISPKIACIDDAIPLIPLFIIPYVWAYVYWGMAPMAVSKCSKEHFLDYLASYMLACIFGVVILVFVPTYMDRVAEGLLDTSRKGFLPALMRFWYSLDGGEMAFNLFPSFHCINSTVSYLGVCGRKEVPLWFRIYSLVVTVLIYASTLFVKQHFIADVIAGIAVALIAFFICKKFKAGRVFNGPIRLAKKLFGKKEATVKQE